MKIKNKVPQTSLFLPDIRSGWNIGSFFRTADSLGIEHVFLSGITPYPPHKEISKTALDADVFVSWTYFSNSLEGLQELKKQNIRLIAMELVDKAQNILEYDFSQYKQRNEAMCLVMGNEISGVSSEILEICDDVVYIPMQGKKQSMNVSIAGSIGMWEMVKNISSFS